MKEIKIVKLKDVKSNPNNPRIIKDEKFKKLVKSIQEFPEMLKIRPIVVNSDLIVLGGNMRLKACNDAGLKEIPIIIADELSDEQQREFIIKDNVGYGEWDWDMLKNEWIAEELEEWGLQLPMQFNSDIDYSDKNEEIDIDALDSDMIIKLKYTEDEYYLVREQLSKIAATPEQAVWKLLGNE
jgi:hypothetical protein